MAPLALGAIERQGTAAPGRPKGYASFARGGLFARKIPGRREFDVGRIAAKREGRGFLLARDSRHAEKRQREGGEPDQRSGQHGGLVGRQQRLSAGS
jgi:hypothetical protein